MSLISYVNKIHFADNVLEVALEAELELLGLKQPLIICDDGDSRNDVIERLLAAVPPPTSPALFRSTTCPATEDACIEAARLFLESEADGIIAFGGPSAMNLAKAVGLAINHHGPLGLYAGGEGGGKRIRDLIPPLIAIPTSSGSCIETNGVAIIAMRDGSSASFVSPNLTPRVVICDPTLTLDLPASQTASAGMDALTHCVETFIGIAYNPPADGIARDGLRRASAHLERAVADGADLVARREMMAAALNGSLAGQKGLGGVHAMSHALAAVVRGMFDHGAVNAILLPHVLEFNAPAVSPRYADIKHELGLPSGCSLPDALVRLRERIALPARLSQIGIGSDHLEQAAAFAAADYSNRTNPRHADTQDYLRMLHAAL